MTCPRCHAENRDGLRFCEDCGSRLTQTCAQCGGELAPGKRFCGSCGTPAADQATARTTSPESYTPKHLAEKILTSKAALEGERKQVTVLFADLKGSMELLADRDPEEARKLLDPVLERMMEAVHHYEGTVNQVMGDGIMALFGAPVAHEDHAVRACYAALDMQGAIRRYAEEVWRAHGITVQIRVGLNSGEVVVRAIGSDLRVDYTAVGQTTHLAARMEQLATPGTVLLTADTLRLAEGYVTAKPLGPVPVKGLEAPMEVYELTGAGPLRSRLQAAAARGLTRFVGRETEVEQLRQALGRAAAGHGQLMALVGEPGVGKSRLVWEVTHSHLTHGWRILESGSVSYGKATSYLPVIDLLKAYFGVQDRDGPREIQEKVTGKVLTLGRALEPSLPALLALLDVPVAEGDWMALDPARRRQLTLDAVKRLVLRESQVQPVLFVFEDLHWIDTETQALLDTVVDSLPTARVLLFVNYRPEYTHRWGSKSYYMQLRLDPLPIESAHELLDALLGSDPGIAALKALLIARTEGNPLFLEESIRTLVETGTLAGERGAYRLTTTLPSIQVPATVHAVLAARIDRLPTHAKRLLQSAAVIGKDVPLALLEAIADEPGGDLRQDLAQLQAAELLYETSLFPDIEYTFKHALTHEVAYGGLLHERRRGLHARIIDAMERLYVDRLSEHVEQLALHALRGEAWAKAVGYLRQAGAKAFGRSANREARAWFDQALDALQHLPETGETVEQAIDLRLEVRRSLFSLGEFTRISDLLAESESRAARLGDQRRLGRIFAHTTQHFTWAGDYGRAVDYGQRAAALATSQGDLGVRLIANAYLGAAYYNQGDWPQTIVLSRTNLGLLSGSLIRERFGQQVHPSVYSLTYLVWCLAEQGKFAEGALLAAQGVDLAEDLDQPFTRAVAYLGIGGLRLREGTFDQAASALEKGLALCREWDIPFWIHWITARLGYAYAFLGRREEASSLLEMAVKHAAATRFVPGYSQGLAWLGEVHVHADRTDAAREAGTSALNHARRHGERGIEAWGLRLLGDVASHADALDRAAAGTHYNQAIALAVDLGMRPLAAHCHLGLGKLYRQTGDGAKAKEHLATAATMYREMGMTFWLEKADADGGGVER